MSDHITDPHASGQDHGLRWEHALTHEALDDAGVPYAVGATLVERVKALRVRAEAAEAVAERWRAQTEQARAELERVTGELEDVGRDLEIAGVPLEADDDEGGIIRLSAAERVELLATRARDAEGERDAFRSEVAVHRADLAAAAGDLPVPLPGPGTDMARLLLANRLLRADVELLRSDRKRIEADSSRLRAAAEEAAETFGTIAANLNGRMYNIAKAQAKRAAKSFTAALSPAPGEAKACGDAGVCARPIGHGDPHASVRFAADLGPGACRYPHPTASDLACSREVGHVGVHQLVGSPECWLTRTPPILDAETEIAMQELKTFGEVIELTPTTPEEARGEERDPRAVEFDADAALRQHALLHPSGHCTCAGERECEWCREHCAGCGVLSPKDFCVDCSPAGFATPTPEKASEA